MKNPIYFLGKPIADKFRESVSGDKNGMAGWVDKIAQDGDRGFYGPGTEVWEVHSSLSTIIGGISALLLQAIHPAALQGVKSHSRYQSDLFGRLIGTTQWITITTFGSTANISEEAARVNAMHSRVSGTYQKQNGEVEPYKASMENFLLWVHCAFTLSFWNTYLIYGPKNKVSADNYIAQWSKSAEPLGLFTAPKTLNELEVLMGKLLENELSFTKDTKEVVGFILNPPFPFFTKLVYKVLAKGALFSIPDSFLNLLEIKRPNKIWASATKLILGLIGIGLDGESPAKLAAIARIKRWDQF